MSFNHIHYVPCLRWKQGEYQAVYRLKAETKKFITPLIEAPEISWDFEDEEYKKTITEHLSPFAKRIKNKWGTGICFVDFRLIEPLIQTTTDLNSIESVFDELRARSVNGIAVTGINRSDAYSSTIRSILAKCNSGLCFRIKVEQAAKNDFKNQVKSLLSFYSLNKDEVDFILDLNAPKFTPIDGFCKLIRKIIDNIPDIDKWRSFTLIGTSFPESMAGLSNGVNFLYRYEWLLYGALIENLRQEGGRLPTFGDYAISHTEPPDMDYRLLKPSASIRYSTDTQWCIIKGTSVRHPPGFYQYHSMCDKLAKLPCFSGRNFSEGDKYIDDCSRKKVSSGNLTTWRMVGTNHHIERVVTDVSSFFAS